MSNAAKRKVEVTLELGQVDGFLYVTEFAAREALGDLSELSVTFAVRDRPLDLEQVLDQSASLQISSETGFQYFDGVVAYLGLEQLVGRYWVYRAEILPMGHRLLHRRDCRVFQERSARQIVEEVLGEAGVALRFLRGNPDTPVRDYCVQYREPTWQFVCRLLEEEGYFYRFDHERRHHTVVVGNAVEVHPPVAEPDEVRFHPPGRGDAPAGHIWTFGVGRRFVSTRATLADFNLERPSLSLLRSKGEANGVEHYDFPGDFSWRREGDRRAQMRLEEAAVAAHALRGQSDLTRFRAGHVFTLTDHPLPSLSNEPYLLTWVEHHGISSGTDLTAGQVDAHCTYDNRFGCIPRAVPFRPPRRAPRPLVTGVQTATVEGPKNQETYTDRLGRVKVRFHWDREGGEKRSRGGWKGSSCWVPVSQPWAGRSHGAFFLPRVGDEVVVDFLEGEPHRPVVTGRVYHGHNEPIFGLPKADTRSGIRTSSSPGSEGYSELVFDDKKGAELVSVRAQRDLSETVVRNRRTEVGSVLATHVSGQAEVRVGKVAKTDSTKTQSPKTGDDAKGQAHDDMAKDEPKGALTVVAEGVVTAKSDTKHVQIEGAKWVEVTSGKSTILLKDNGEVTVTADRVKVNGKKLVKLTGGSAGVTISDAGVAIQGHTVKLNGVGMTEVKGAVVKIN